MQGITEQVLNEVVGAVDRGIKMITGDTFVPIPQVNTHVMVMRIPDAKSKHHYSKRVTVAKADRLVNGKVMINRETGEKVRVPLKRKYILVEA